MDPLSLTVADDQTTPKQGESDHEKRDEDEEEPTEGDIAEDV